MVQSDNCGAQVLEEALSAPIGFSESREDGSVKRPMAFR